MGSDTDPLAGMGAMEPLVPRQIVQPGGEPPPTPPQPPPAGGAQPGGTPATPTVGTPPGATPAGAQPPPTVPELPAEVQEILKAEGLPPTWEGHKEYLERAREHAAVLRDAQAKIEEQQRQEYLASAEGRIDQFLFGDVSEQEYYQNPQGVLRKVIGKAMGLMAESAKNQITGALQSQTDQSERAQKYFTEKPHLAPLYPQIMAMSKEMGIPGRKVADMIDRTMQMIGMQPTTSTVPSNPPATPSNPPAAAAQVPRQPGYALPFQIPGQTEMTTGTQPNAPGGRTVYQNALAAVDELMKNPGASLEDMDRVLAGFKFE